MCRSMEDMIRTRRATSRITTKSEPETPAYDNIPVTWSLESVNELESPLQLSTDQSHEKSHDTLKHDGTTYNPSEMTPLFMPSYMGMLSDIAREIKLP
ncbi:hypothetical protein RRF57_008624 [Xylaria bambusicola]|uniref:Uncharacterized protein n=1 Tax=Xylaria bambusicola TaxID=326684 RepID=A0AAN7UI61_9PEZI